MPLTKHQELWNEDRKEWIHNNPPDHAGYWYCVVGFGYLTEDTLTLDHDHSRSRRPQERYLQSNLQAMCGYHNGDKGSRSLEEYKKSKPRLNCDDRQAKAYKAAITKRKKEPR